jgi:hypothetical protein
MLDLAIKHGHNEPQLDTNRYMEQEHVEGPFLANFCYPGGVQFITQPVAIVGDVYQGRAHRFLRRIRKPLSGTCSFSANRPQSVLSRSLVSFHHGSTTWRRKSACRQASPRNGPPTVTEVSYTPTMSHIPYFGTICSSTCPLIHQTSCRVKFIFVFSFFLSFSSFHFLRKLIRRRGRE